MPYFQRQNSNHLFLRDPQEKSLLFPWVLLSYVSSLDKSLQWGDCQLVQRDYNSFCTQGGAIMAQSGRGARPPGRNGLCLYIKRMDRKGRKTQMSIVVWKRSSSYCLSLLLGWRICLGEWPEGISCCCSVAQLCSILRNPTDRSLPGSAVHEISQTRILEWVAISSSRRSSQPRGWTRSPALQPDSLPLSH